MRQRYLALLGAGALLVATAPAANAHGGDGPDIEVIAAGLDNPRGLNFGPFGVLYVAEAGRGGDGPCIIGAQGQEFCLGATGAITAIWGRHQWTVADDLPSLGTTTAMPEVFGPHDVAVSRQGLLVPIGLGTDPAKRDELGPDGAAIATLLKVNPFTGGWRPIADLGEYEAVNDPDQDQPNTFPDSNPYAVIPQGANAIVVDPGGNDLLKVRKSGKISTLQVFDVTFVDGIPMHPVPTTVARGPDGAYYVGQLTGFPFPVGGAKVWRVRPGHEPVVVADGFTNIIDITFDTRGRLIVLEMFTNGLLSNDPTGALWRVERDGTHTLLASEGLVTPAGVAIGPDGAFYVTNKGTLIGQGEVLRIRP